MQAVFELPKRMRAALEEDVLDTAVSFYAEAQVTGGGRVRGTQ